MKLVWRGAILLLCTVVVACSGMMEERPLSGAPRLSGDNDVQVASDALLRLLPARDVLHDVTLTQRVDASYARAASSANDKAQQTHGFIVQIEAAGNDMRMVGLTPLGVQMFALVQQGTAVDIEVPAYVSLPFDPRFMLADMQLALAPLAVLGTRLSGATLQQTADGSTRSLIASDGSERMRIRYRGAFCTMGSELDIEHLERHYRIHITTLSCDVP